jgi:hypothetical protein
MLKTEPNRWYDQIVRLIDEFPTTNMKTILSSTSDTDNIRLVSAKFALEISLSQRFIGYDFALSKNVTHGIRVGAWSGPEPFLVENDPDVAEKVYQEMRLFVKNLLSDMFYFGYKNNKAVLAYPKAGDGGYDVVVYPSRRFLASIKRETWSREKIENDFDLKRLIANVSQDDQL